MAGGPRLGSLRPQRGPVRSGQLQSRSSPARGAWGRVGSSRRRPSASEEGCSPCARVGTGPWERAGLRELGKHCVLPCEKCSLAAPPFPVPSANREAGHDLLGEAFSAFSGCQRALKACAPAWPWAEQGLLQVRGDSLSRPGPLSANRTPQSGGKSTERARGALVPAEVWGSGKSLHSSLPSCPSTCTIPTGGKGAEILPNVSARAAGSYLTLPEFGKGQITPCGVSRRTGAG